MLAVQLETFHLTRMLLTSRIIDAPKVRTERWQGKDVKDNPAAVSYELRNVCFEVPLQGIMDLQHWRADIRPNLPWADDHFAERVGGEPLNPGMQWARWPWARSAAQHKTERFNHTYMERLWPKWAGRMAPSDHNMVRNGLRTEPSRKDWIPPIRGIGYSYGDLQDLVELLTLEPYTRQAWIPLFFPEDTGKGDGGRKPCTLGYQIMVRGNLEDGPQAHIYYPLRSCDLVRHFNDDCYMAVRLLIWVIEQCRLRNAPFWGNVFPGTYAMHMTSLHIFENDRQAMLGKVAP